MSTTPAPIFDMSKARPIFDMSKAQAIGEGDSQTAIKQKYGLPANIDLKKSFMAQDTKGIDPMTFSKAYAELNPPPPEAKGFLANMWGEAKDIMNSMSSEGTSTASMPPVPGKGAYETGKARIEQAKTDLPGALGKTATDVAAIAAPLAIAKGIDMLPSAERAGATFAEVKGAAGEVPIDMARPGNTALELYEQSQRGATLPKVVRDFVKRATSPGDEPITYAEAKDFQSNVSALSADERMKLKPNTKRLLGQLNADLKDSLESAADIKGKGEQFTDAMKEYHHAMQLHNFSEEAKSALWKAALTGVGLYGAKKILESVAP